MTEKYSRRQFLKRVFATTLTTVLTSTFGYTYARYLEPKLIELTTHTITHSLIPQAFHDIKIIQFSDTHIGYNFDIDQLQKVVEKINRFSPDLVIFTGDLMDEPNKF